MKFKFKESLLENGLTQVIGVFIDNEGVEKAFKSTSKRVFEKEWKEELISIFVNEKEIETVEIEYLE